MGFGKRVVENFTQLQGSRPVAVLFDSTAGVGKHADIDAVLVHYVDVLSMIEGVKTHASHVILRFGNELEIFAGKRVKVSVDNHGFSFCDLTN